MHHLLSVCADQLAKVVPVWCSTLKAHSPRGRPGVRGPRLATWICSSEGSRHACIPLRCAAQLPPSALPSVQRPFLRDTLRLRVSAGVPPATAMLQAAHASEDHFSTETSSTETAPASSGAREAPRSTLRPSPGAALASAAGTSAAGSASVSGCGLPAGLEGAGV